MKHIHVIIPIAVLLCIALFACGDDDPVSVCETKSWSTIFEDNFNSTTLNPYWILLEGTEDNYVLNGSTLAMDDTPANPDGPVFVYRNTVTNDVTKVTCKLSTLAMSGWVMFGMVIRGDDIESNSYIGYMVGSELILVKILSGSEFTLAASGIVAMASNETRIIELQYDRGTISFIVKAADGTVLGSAVATDPSPLPGGLIGFIAKVDASTNEYLHMDDFKLEKYE